jgi:hypothetical protein
VNALKKDVRKRGDDDMQMGKEVKELRGRNIGGAGAA